MTEQKNKKWRGFAAPQSAAGDLALYGPPPWNFEGFTASVVLEFDPSKVASLIPPPLKLAGDPIARLSVHDIICDYGLGPRFVQENPDQSNFGEAVIGFMVKHGDIVGQWCPYLWCTTDAEFAVGREFYGWSQRIAAMSLTQRPFRGWRSNDMVAGVVARGHREVFNFVVTLERSGDLPEEIAGLKMFPSQVKANQHFTQTIIPEPTKPGERRRRLFRTPMHNVILGDIWSGTAEVEIRAPELNFLKGVKPLAGRWNEIAWTKPYPEEILLDEQIPL